jgi:F420 biosynthesis protein FbiB-like protein
MRNQELVETIAKRRSVRRFEARALPAGTLQRLVEVAATAPSAHHAQPWRFVIVAPGPGRKRLARAMAGRFHDDLEADGVDRRRIEQLVAAGRRRLVEAPGLVAVCLAKGALAPATGRRRQRIERALATQSVAAAATTLLLAAHAEGLGAYWLSAPLFAPGAVRRALDLPADWDPQAFILVGYAAGKPPVRDQLPLDHVLSRRG